MLFYVRGTKDNLMLVFAFHIIPILRFKVDSAITESSLKPGVNLLAIFLSEIISVTYLCRTSDFLNCVSNKERERLHWTKSS